MHLADLIRCQSMPKHRATAFEHTWPEIVYLDIPASPCGIQTCESTDRTGADHNALDGHVYPLPRRALGRVKQCV